jgi:translation elongation factor EF-G
MVCVGGLEPITKVEVVTPDEYMGDICGTDQSKYGRVCVARFPAVGPVPSS